MTEQAGVPIEQFDPVVGLGPRTLVEASAGTGKTYALCGLAAYLVGSGAVTVEELLVVTFTNLATDDLRDRIRERFVSVSGDVMAGSSRRGDVVASKLGQSADVDEVRRRLDVALSELGNLSVSTIHGFAQRSLASFGGAFGFDPDLPVLIDDEAILVDAVADELAVQAMRCPTFDGDDRLWLPPKSRVLDIARLLDDVPDIEIRPVSDMRLSFPTLVGRHRGDVLAKEEAVRNELEQATSETAKKRARKPVDDHFVAVELVRSAWVATRALERARQRRRAAGVRNYGDLLTDLRRALIEDESGRLASQLRDRHRVALIDEFQDTDRVQWDIFDACFGKGGSCLVLVGDPKQAIYRFRGADVHTYARVAESDGISRRSLGINQRSDGALLAAFSTLFSGVSFGPEAPFVDVMQSPRRHWSAIRWRDGTGEQCPIPPLRIAVDGESSSDGRGDAEPLFVGQAGTSGDLTSIDADVVDWIRRLHFGAEIAPTPKHTPDDLPRWRDVEYTDIALLTTTNRSAVELQHTLIRHGIPASIHVDDDVRLDAARTSFGENGRRQPPSEAAWNWQILLDAVRHPSNPELARAAATTVFGPDLDASDTVASVANEVVLKDFQEQVAHWADVLHTGGPASMIARLRAETDWLARAVGRGDQGRLATDIEHIGELLCAIGRTASVDELLAGLDVGSRADIESSGKGMRSVATRRVASDEPAVTIMTIHKSKGLEFPIVGCLGLHESRPPQADGNGLGRAARFHDAELDREVIDVARSAPSLEAEAGEARADDLRKLYVALTRAGHHVFTYWTEPRAKWDPGPLTRVLFERGGDGEIDPATFVDRPGTARGTRAVSTDTVEGKDTVGRDRRRVLDRITEASRCHSSEGTAAIVWVDLAFSREGVHADDRRTQALDEGASAAVTTDVLGAATLELPPGRRTRRWSFTAMSSEMLSARHDDEVLTVGGADEGNDDPTASGALTVGGGRGESGPLQRLRAGADFGLLVHDILEEVDFDADRETLGRVVERRHRLRQVDLVGEASRPADGDGTDDLVEGLWRALHAPIGSVGPDGSVLQLCDVTRDDRLSECRFDLRLDTRPDGVSVGRSIARLLVDGDRGLAADDPYRPWAEQLLERGFNLDLAGYLTGSIDLVYRVRDADGTPRFHIADYKTNRIDSYVTTAVVDKMIANDYPLQALVYSVGLHRYLRWRLDGYDPRVHLGAVTYLFVRGMTSGAYSGGGDPPGVARWEIPVSVVEGLDALFAGREVRP